MTALAAVVVVLALGAQQAGVSLTSDALTQVRELYALASYEEALSRLDAVGTSVNPGRAAQYRALCLLGLGRTADADRTLEQLVMEHPGYSMPEDEVSPRLATMFKQTRQRLLPAAARARYAQAKTLFDRQQFEDAARGFREVDSLLSDEAFIAANDGLRDLKVLSEGFRNLAEGEITKANQAARTPAPVTGAQAAPVPAVSTPAAPSAPPVPVAAAPVTAASTVPVIYSESDSSVQAPTDVTRRLPAWNPPPALARMEFRGVLEVIINEQGAVTATEMVEAVHASYDPVLLEAAKRWRFRPATRNGSAVQYRKTFEIVLNRR
jgi:TonB family protein